MTLGVPRRMLPAFSPGIRTEGGSGREMSGLRLYIDIDDVLAETTRALAWAAQDLLGKKVLFDEMSSFDLRISLQLDAEEYESFMLAVHEPEFLMKLEPVENAIQTLEKRHAAGDRLELVTGRPPESRKPTEEWLAAHSVPHHSVEFMDKYDRYRDLDLPRLPDLAARHYDLAIEDSYKVAAYLAEQTGSQTLLFDRPWNRGMDLGGKSISRVFNWLEIAEHCAREKTSRG